ncbi:hypothetical protein FRC04_005807 [Tulasnella sp. 424]|nr:hypothetical protein FRC04_005807 [Tulasnella sp. 424]KAG8964704.1 hypothetical protein FRC05_003603 [Tulasnella sp. 425]
MPCSVKWVSTAPSEYRAKKLSPFTVPAEDQLALLEAQIALAIELRRSISIHSVKVQQVTLDILKRLKEKYGEDFGKLNIDLHSCGFSAESWKEVEVRTILGHVLYIANIAASASKSIRTSSSLFRSLLTAVPQFHEALIRKSSPDRILSESDFNDITNSTPYTGGMVCSIARLKGWSIETESWNDDGGLEDGRWGAVRRLERTWRRFIGPVLGLALDAPRASRKTRHLNDPAHKWGGE